MHGDADPDARKRLLVARAELDRLKLAQAVHDVRGIARAPLAGFARAGRAVRALSLGLAVWRLLRGLRR